MTESFRIASLDKCDFLLDRLEYFISQQYEEQYNYTFGEFSRLLLKAIQSPNYWESAEMRKRIKDIYIKSKKYVRKLIVSSSKMSLKLRLIIYYTNLHLYGLVRNVFRTNKL